MWIRHFRPEDAAPCADLFFRAVHEGAAERYDAHQRRAWLPRVPDPGTLCERLSAQTCFVAQDAEITGFMSLTRTGYLDLAYVAPARRGTGLADQLYAAILNAARVARHATLSTHASLYAQPFFSRQGWRVLAPEKVERDGVLIPRFRMALSFPE
ncbi:MAG: GNAT family N-acetyltransferase [Pseudomonadota bacterium]